MPEQIAFKYAIDEIVELAPTRFGGPNGSSSYRVLRRHAGGPSGPEYRIRGEQDGQERMVAEGALQPARSLSPDR